MSQLLKKEFRWLKKKKRFNNAHKSSVLCKFGPVGSEILCITLFFLILHYHLFIIFIYLFLAVLGLHCCTQVFSSCNE